MLALEEASCLPAVDYVVGCLLHPAAARKFSVCVLEHPVIVGEVPVL